MKKSVSLIIAVLAVFGLSLTADAGFKIGPRLGINVNKISFDKNMLFSGSNRCGFTGGVQVEYITKLNLGFDISVMYSYMDFDIDNESDNPLYTMPDFGKNFIEIPLNIKYMIGIPAVSKFFKPFIFTGPCVAIKLDKGDNYWKTRTSQWTWNFGIGFEFIRHLQISGSYGLGINNLVDGKSIDNIPIKTDNLKARNNYWTITAAWLF